MKNAGSQSLHLFYKDVDRFDRITIEEEQELAKIIQTQTGKERQDAIDKLVNSNLRLVRTIVSDYAHMPIDISDLISEGNYGLYIAAKRYKAGTGAKFSTYAAWWIKQKITRYVMEYHPLFHIPCQAKSRMLEAMRKAEESFEVVNFDLPDEVVLASGKYLSKNAKHCTMLTIVCPLAMFEEQTSPNLTDAVRKRKNGYTDSVDEDIIVDASDVSRLVHKEYALFLSSHQLGHLSDKERQATILYYGLDSDEPMTQAQIAQQMGVTTQYVSQLLINAKAILRKLFDDDFNPKYKAAMKA